MAAGFAAGFQSGYGLIESRERRKDAEEERNFKREERQRERDIRADAGDTLGAIGQERPTGYRMAPGATGNLDEGGAYEAVMAPYGARQAYEDYARKIASKDPRMAVQYRGFADQEEARGLQLKGAKRTDKHADREDAVLEFQRKYANLPDDQYARKVAQFASQHVPDGYTFGVEIDPNEGMIGVQVAPDGSVARKPIPSRQALDQQLMMYASPAMYRQTRTEQRLDRQATRLENRDAKQDAHWERGDANNERRHRENLAFQRERLSQRPGARDHFAEMEAQVDAYAMALLRSGQAKSQDEATRMAWAARMRDPNNRGAAGLQAVPGSRGMFRDGDQLYRLDEETNELKPVKTQKSTAEIAEVMRGNLGNRPGVPQPAAPAQGRGLAGVLDQQRGVGRGLPRLADTESNEYYVP